MEGVIVTGDVFVSDPARREELRSAPGATAVEMGGAALVQRVAAIIRALNPPPSRR